MQPPDWNFCGHSQKKQRGHRASSDPAKSYAVQRRLVHTNLPRINLFIANSQWETSISGRQEESHGKKQSSDFKNNSVGTAQRAKAILNCRCRVIRHSNLNCCSTHNDLITNSCERSQATIQPSNAISQDTAELGHLREVNRAAASFFAVTSNQILNCWYFSGTKSRYRTLSV